MLSSFLIFTVYNIICFCGGILPSSTGFIFSSSAQSRSIYLGGSLHHTSTSHHTIMSAANNGVSTEPSKLLVSRFQQISQVSDPDGKLRLVLASQSPRRTEILEMMGLAGRFTAIPSPLDEEKLQVELSQREITPPDYARILAERKAHAYGAAAVDSTNESVTLIIGSDTIVDFDGHIMNKPSNAEDANRMLSMLSGNWHQVHTGVAVYAVDTMKPDSTEPKLMFSFTDTAKVKFSSLTETDIKAYIDTKEPFDKAGSYGIQGIGGQLVERIEGDFFTVMGLPMHRLSRELTDALNEVA
jgi:septum formation protein